MKKKIIVLSHKMSKEKWERIEFKYLKNSEIEIHDCSKFLLNNPDINVENELYHKNKIIFKNFFSWKNHLSKMKIIAKKEKIKLIVLDTIGNFDNFSNSFYLFLIYMYLKKKNIFLAKFHYPGMPVSYFLAKEKNYLIKKSLLVLKSFFLTPLLIINKFKAHFFLKLGKLFNLYPQLVFVAGKKYIDRIKKQNRKVDIIPISTIDYSKILIKKKKKMKSINYQKNYAVYISDRDYMTPPEEAFYDKSIKSRLSLNGWHIPLVKFFDYLEKKLNLKIIIAAHPKSIKSNTIKMFKPRKVIFGKTYKLIENCKFVISLRSSALNFAVIYKKPIIFLSAKELTNSENLSIQSIANHFNKIPININNNLDKIEIKKYLNFNSKNFNNFKSDYISNLQYDRPNHEIINEKISSLN